MTPLFLAKIKLYAEFMGTDNLTAHDQDLFILLGQDPEVKDWAQNAIETAIKKGY